VSTGPRVLIVGAGHGGAQVAIALRRQKFPGTITILGDEPHLPYERPALSKEYLSGIKPWERMLLLPERGWREREVSLLPNRRVVSVDPAAHTVSTASGEHYTYDALVWATGGTPRRLTCEGHDAARVCAVRNRGDVDTLLQYLPDVKRVVVIGGGYIGLEAAAVLIKQGKEVTVLEALDRVLARVAGEPLSQFYEAEHRAQGVNVVLGAVVDRVIVERGRAIGIRLKNGSEFRAQVVIVGIGIAPAVEPLLAAGAQGGNGVRVDELCRTSLPAVYAIGDCAEHRNSFAGGDWVRLECVQNAHDQAAVVAGTIMGRGVRYESVPWFWSNQYDLRLQTIGLARGHDDIIVRGNPSSREFSLIYLRDSTVIALDCVNSPRDFVQGKALISGAVRPDRAAAENTNMPLKALLPPRVHPDPSLETTSSH
jgi:3-phenylpropionate/trans-cinnamate dioxygenase ferredoxin reductase component